MKRQKAKENKSEGQVKNTENSWKTKATDRAKIIKQQNKRILEVERSHDLWKSKYKEKLIEGHLPCFDSKKAKHYQYSLLVILWVVQMQNYG